MQLHFSIEAHELNVKHRFPAMTLQKIITCCEHITRIVDGCKDSFLGNEDRNVFHNAQYYIEQMSGIALSQSTPQLGVFTPYFKTVRRILLYYTQAKNHWSKPCKKRVKIIKKENMNILIIILLALVAVVALLLIIGLFTRKEYDIEQEVVIEKPKEKVFDFVKLLKNQDHFNKWVMMDPN